MIMNVRRSCCGVLALLLLFGATCYAESSGQQTTPESKVTEVPVNCPTSNPQAQDLYNSALSAKKAGKLKEAEGLYRQAIEKDGKYCDAMDNLGQLLRSEGKLNEAITWYKRSLEVKPDNATAHQNLAVAYKFQKNLDGAQAEYQWLIKNDPGNPEGFYGIGWVLMDKGDYDAAIERLKSAEQIYRQTNSPLVSDARFLIGGAYFKKKDYVNARAWLLQAYPEMQDAPSINYILGLCYLDPATGDKKQASLYLRKAKSLGVKLPPGIESQLQ